MGMFGTKKNIFNCTSCSEPHLTQEEIDALPKSIKVHAAKADIQDLISNPMELIEAPGIGKAIEVISMSFKYDYVSIAYNAITLNLTTNTATSNWLTTGTISGIADKNSIAVPTTPSIISTLTGPFWIENEPVNLTASGAPGNGNGTFDFYILYRIITL